MEERRRRTVLPTTTTTMTMTMTTTHNSSNNKNDDDNDEETTRLLNHTHTSYNTTNDSTGSARRYVNLFLIVWTTPGIKFFKSAQSSFQEYLMHNPQVHLSATTYGLILSLISMPVVPLIGGILLDYKGGTGRRVGEHSGRTHSVDEKEDEDERYREVTPATTTEAHDLVTSLRTLAYGTTVTVTGTGRVDGAAPPPVEQTHALCVFSVVTFGGIVVYGLGMEVAHNIPLGLLGAVIFGLGEGCIMVAARAFIGHEFRSADGATAQGVLIAMNNFAMMASKNSLPWLIETAHHHHRITSTTTTTTTTPENDENNDNDDNYSIAIGIVACISVQLVSTGASIWYSLRCRRFQKQQQQQQQQQQQDRAFQDRNRPQADERMEKERTKQQHQYPNHTTHYQQYTTGFEGGRGGEDDDDDAVTRNSVSSREEGRMRSSRCGGLTATGCAHSGVTSITTLFHLPLTFWIVAIARAIFLVTFKVFSRYSNSFLIVSSFPTMIVGCGVDVIFLVFNSLECKLFICHLFFSFFSLSSLVQNNDGIGIGIGIKSFLYAIDTNSTKHVVLM